MKEEKETNEKKIEINDKKDNNDNLIIKNNSLYSNLFISQEANISFEQSKTQGYQKLSEDAFRCHLCKELMTTRLKRDGEYINIDYSCPNHHFGSLDMDLFLNKFPHFSFVYQKCSKCGLKQKNTNEIFYYCKDCKETYCQNHIKDCKLNKEKVVSVEDIDYLCLDHNKDYISYCEKCNENLCEICTNSNKHKDHQKYYFKTKILGREENDKIDQFIQHSIIEKKRFEIEIEKMTIKNLDEKLEKSIFIMRKNVSEKIKVYGDLILYLSYIKKAYTFSVNCNRFNHQIITNLYELVKNQLYFINEVCNDINAYTNKINDYIREIYLAYRKESMQILNNKNGIRLKDQKIENCNNNIRIFPELDNDIKEIGKEEIKKFEDGEYKGQIKDGLPHGKGEYKYKNGDEYNGSFKKGLYDGYGVKRTKNGESYFGFWKDNKRDGKGKYIFSNGDYYEGEFKEDMFNGKGTLFYINGNKTIGNWKNNKRNGNEYLVNNKGEIFFHVYENNTLIQQTICDKNKFLKDFGNFEKENINEYLNNLIQKDLKKK